MQFIAVLVLDSHLIYRKEVVENSQNDVQVIESDSVLSV